MPWIWVRDEGSAKIDYALEIELQDKVLFKIDHALAGEGAQLTRLIPDLSCLLGITICGRLQVVFQVKPVTDGVLWRDYKFQ